MRKLFLSLVFLSSVLLSSEVNALPRFALLSGTRCSACHVNPQGGGLRTELGYQMMSETGLWKWSTPTEEEEMLGAVPTNMFLDGLIMPGGDLRVQQVRRSSDGTSLLIPMQFSPSLAVMPSKELTVYGNYNIAGAVYRARKGSSTYPGQTDWEAAIQYQPSLELPGIRAGMIQPSVGIRHDDHTMFARREVASNGINILPPYYNDIGAEITYEGLYWLTVNAGIFNAYNLAKADPSIGVVDANFDFAKPTMLARVMLWPQLLDEGINGELGASILTNGEFQMINAFGGFGIGDKATLFVEGVYAKNAADRIVRNFSVMGSYNFKTWLSGHWRYEWAQTELYPNRGLAHANAFIVGAEFFPFPMVELRPEYRFFERHPFNQGNSTFEGQYTVQLHLFY